MLKFNFQKCQRIERNRESKFFGGIYTLFQVVKMKSVIFKEPCPPCKQYGRPRMRSNRAQLLVTTLPAGGKVSEFIMQVINYRIGGIQLQNRRQSSERRPHILGIGYLYK